MRAKELVPILAEIYGVPFDTAYMIDRSLSEAGLRAKGRGKSLPEMTRREAIIFLVACMVTLKATKAGQEVQPWLTASGWLMDEDPDLPDELTGDEPLFVRNHYMGKVVEALAKYPTKADDDFFGFDMIDCLMVVCEVIESSGLTGEAFKFEISVSHGWAAVSINEGFSGGYSEIRFQTEAGANDPVSYETQISKTAVIYGEALMAIAARTAPEVLH